VGLFPSSLVDLINPGRALKVDRHIFVLPCMYGREPIKVQGGVLISSLETKERHSQRKKDTSKKKLHASLLIPSLLLWLFACLNICLRFLYGLPGCRFYFPHRTSAVFSLKCVSDVVVRSRRASRTCYSI
jgi:hypothetical protein